MAWYATGTATFTNSSAIVTGTGTSWIANVSIGDALHAPDGRAYEITGIASDNSLTIDPAYQATTASDAAYKVQPTRGVTLSLRDQVAGLITTYQGVVDGAGAGKFAAGDAAAPSIRGVADQDTGINLPGGNLLEFILGGVKAGWIDGATNTLKGAMVQSSPFDVTAAKLLAVGAFGLGEAGPTPITNWDTTLLPGLYAADNNGTGSPFSSGGFAGLLVLPGQNANNTMQIGYYLAGNGPFMVRGRSGGSWGDWREVYLNSTIVGTVSQSGGIPTGAIIERGSNANGEYVRFADGTQICRHRLTLTYNSAASCSATWSFPAAFVAVNTPTVCANYVATNTASTGAAELGVTRCFGTSSSTRDIYQYRISGATNFTAGDNLDTDVIAVGEWF